MTANGTFLNALAEATQRVVEVSPVREATALGAAFAAGLAVGTWQHEHEIADTWNPSFAVIPERRLDRDRWREAVAHAAAWLPDLTSIDF
jgi:glycerol kinase